MRKEVSMKVQKARLRFALALGLTCLVSALALLIGYGSVLAINNFSPNQELPLPLLAPITPPPAMVSFIVRGLEPSVRVDQQGTVYVSSIRGVPGGVDLHRWYQTADGAPNGDGTLPFKYEGQPDNCGIFASSGCANNSLDPFGVGLGGGDVDIAVNYPPLPTDVPNLALVSLTLAPGITGTHSTTRGDSFSAPNTVVAAIPGDDRQWIDGFGGLSVYLNYHDVTTFNIEVQRSNDGGVTYTDGFGEAIDPQTLPVAGGVPPTNTANIAGQIKVDRSSCPNQGNLYQIFVAPETVLENLSGKLVFRSVYVGVSTDVKMGLPVFTFTDHKVFTGPADPNQPGGNNGNLFPALAVDNFGNLYAVWSDNSKIFYSFSTDIGTTWAPAIDLTANAPTKGNANVFPWVAADANGHVGVVWFGDNLVGNSNDRGTLELGHPPSQGAACNNVNNMPVTDCMKNWAQWNVYYAETFNGHDPLGPTFAVNAISDHVIHRGTISTGGLGGGADRSLADLFQIAFDPNHGANVAFSDDHKVSDVGPKNGPDNPTTRRLIRANFTRQLMPTAAGSIVTTGFCAVGPGEPGPSMTGGGRLGPDVNFGFVARANPLNGALEYQDQAQSLNVHSSGGITSVSFSGVCADFNGNAKVNGQTGYTFRVHACDNAEPGAGSDFFSIDVSSTTGFAYHKEGIITDGNIQAH